MAFEIGGVDIADGTALETYVSIPDPDNVGMNETWTCEVNYEKPDVPEAGFGMSSTAETEKPSFTVENLYGKDKGTANGLGTWFGDETNPEVSYVSKFNYPDPNAKPTEEEEGEEDGEEKKAVKNSW